MERKLMTSSIITSPMLVIGAAVTTDPVGVNGGIVHFKGELANVARAVSTQSSDQVATLGRYRTASFIAVGDTTAQVPFSIVLNDCSPKVAAAAVVTLSGQSDITNNNLLAITSANSGTAVSGVKIETLDDASTAPEPGGATSSTAQALIKRTNVLRFSVRYKTTATGATLGQANADTTSIMKCEQAVLIYARMTFILLDETISRNDEGCGR